MTAAATGTSGIRAAWDAYLLATRHGDEVYARPETQQAIGHGQQTPDYAAALLAEDRTFTAYLQMSRGGVTHTFTSRKLGLGAATIRSMLAQLAGIAVDLPNGGGT